MKLIPVDREALKRIAMRSLQGMAIVSLVFSVVMGILVLATFLQLKANDPLATPALVTLYERLRDNPQDASLKQELRSLDLLARKAYFTSRHQVTLGGVLLLAGASVFILCYFLQELLKRKMPASPKGRSLPALLADRLLARKLVAATGAALFVFSVVFLLVLAPLIDSFAVAAGKPDAASPAPSVSIEKIYSDEFLANWPNFRGPFGRARAAQGDWPLSFDAPSGAHILWKKTPPKPGVSSPVVFGDKVLVTGATKSDEGIYCYHAATGALVFSHEMPALSANRVTVDEQTGYAAPTVATDGKVVVAVFANGDVVAVDMQGQMLWAENLGTPEINYGYASSPVTVGDMVVIQFDQKKGPKLIAKKLATGETVYEVEREVLSSWASPIVGEVNGKAALILSANPYVMAHDPFTGKELWRADIFSGEIGSSPVFADGTVFAGNDTARLAALSAFDGSVLWEYYEDLPDASSPAVALGLLFMASAGGFVTCVDVKTGETVWKQEFTDGFYASPVIAGDRVYFLDKEGVMHILALGREYALVGTAVLGEQAVATPAFVNNRIYIRGKKNLYCIGN